MLYEVLHESIRWDKSNANIKCKICRRNTDEAYMLLCDGCDLGFHMFCLKPRLDTVPEGQWFCKACKPTLTDRQQRRAAAAAARLITKTKKKKKKERKKERKKNT